MSGSYDDPRRRAEVDLLFLDIEKRIEEIRATRGQIILQAADTDLKRTESRMTDRRFLVSVIAGGAALVAAGAGLTVAVATFSKQSPPIVIYTQGSRP